MHQQGKSLRSIATSLKTVSRSTVRRKLSEIGLAEKSKASTSTRKDGWSAGDTEILRKGYEKNQTIAEISDQLSSARSKQSISVKANSLGISQSRLNRKHRDIIADGTAYRSLTDIEHAEIWKSHEAGLTPFETAYLLDMPKFIIDQIYDSLGWKPRRIRYQNQGHLHAKMVRQTEEMLETSFSITNPNHLMVLLTFSANETMRDIHETARLSVLPLKWVERIFGRLDVERIWTVNQTSKAAINIDDYVRFAEICQEELPLLHMLLRPRIST